MRGLVTRLLNGVVPARGKLLSLGRLRRASTFRKYVLTRDRCANAYLGDDTSLCRVLGRYKMFVDTKDHGLSSHLLLDGSWEMWMVETLLDRIKPGMTVVDAGANLGYFTLLMADLVGEKGHVHAFEPNPAIAARLRASVSINGFASRTTVHQVGLSDRAGDAAMGVPAHEPKNGYVVDSLDQGGAFEIELRRLDSFVDLQNVDFIKVDVEGSEQRLWSGMRGIIAKGRPLTVLLEFTPDRYNDPKAFLDQMTADGFRLRHLTLKNGLVPVTAEEILARPISEDQMIMLSR